MRYTFSDDEDSDDFPSKRSGRNSGISTPAEPVGPAVTASGRHVKSRIGGIYGETMLVDQRKELENERMAAEGMNGERYQDVSSGRPQRSNRPRRPTRAPRRIDDSSEDLNGSSDAASSGKEWSGNEEEADEADAEEFEIDRDDEDDEMSVKNSEASDASPEPESLVVELRYKKGGTLSQLKDRWDGSNGKKSADDCIVVDCDPPAPGPARVPTDEAHESSGEHQREKEQQSADDQSKTDSRVEINGFSSQTAFAPDRTNSSNHQHPPSLGLQI
jgi:hypothetical protein